MVIKIIDDELRTGVCAVCHKRKPTITISIHSKGSPIYTTEDWCMEDFHNIQDKTMSLK
jgi:hypothetical protein